jgi:hypothetical protein
MPESMTLDLIAEDISDGTWDQLTAELVGHDPDISPDEQTVIGATCSNCCALSIDSNGED